MTLHARGTELIAAPSNRVWEILSDFHNVDRWATPVTRVIDTGPNPRGLGAARRCHVRGVGDLDETIVEWEEARRLAYRVSAFGPIGGATSRWTLEPVTDQTTRVHLELDYDLRFGALGAAVGGALVGRRIEHRLPGVLRALKRHVEGGPAPGLDLEAHVARMMKRRGSPVTLERFESAAVRSDGIELHLDIAVAESARATVVFIPGTAVYGLVFADFLAALADRGYNVVSFDPRGHGLSKGRRASYTIPEIVRDARAAIAYARDRFGGALFVAGSSQGGIAAFYTAASDEPLAGAICHNAADLADPRNAELTAHPRLARALKRALLLAASAAPEAGLDMQWYFHLLSRKHREVKELLAADPLTLKTVRLRSLASLASAPLPRPIEAIQTPILILHGARDTIFPLPYMQRLYQRLTCDKAFELYPDVDHFLVTGHADRVATDCAAWMDRMC